LRNVEDIKKMIHHRVHGEHREEDRESICHKRDWTRLKPWTEWHCRGHEDTDLFSDQFIFTTETQRRQKKMVHHRVHREHRGERQRKRFATKKAQNTQNRINQFRLEAVS